MAKLAATALPNYRNAADRMTRTAAYRLAFRSHSKPKSCKVNQQAELIRKMPHLMEIHRAGSKPTKPANPDYFTGTVWMDTIVDAPDPARLSALRVSFEPGARTAWHTHPLGQTLHVLFGVGRIQKDGEQVQEIRPGDTVWIPPHVRHWHGAAPDTGMVHLAMQETLDGSAADWLEQVSDADYNAAPKA